MHVTYHLKMVYSSFNNLQITSIFGYTTLHTCTFMLYNSVVSYIYNCWSLENSLTTYPILLIYIGKSLVAGTLILSNTLLVHRKCVNNVLVNLLLYSEHDNGNNIDSKYLKQWCMWLLVWCCVSDCMQDVSCRTLPIVYTRLLRGLWQSCHGRRLTNTIGKVQCCTSKVFL